MRPTSEVIAPHQGRLARRKETFMLVHVAYLVFHSEARAPHLDHTHPDLYGIRAHHRQHISTGDFFDKHSVVRPVGACLNTWIVRGVRDNAFCFLLLLARRPLLQPRIELVKIVDSCFLEIGKVDGIIHMGQGIRITKSNLYRIPATKILTHSVIAFPFLLCALLTGKTLKHSALFHFGSQPVTEQVTEWFERYNGTNRI